MDVDVDVDVGVGVTIVWVWVWVWVWVKMCVCVRVVARRYSDVLSSQAPDSPSLDGAGARRRDGGTTSIPAASLHPSSGVPSVVPTSTPRHAPPPPPPPPPHSHTLTDCFIPEGPVWGTREKYVFLWGARLWGRWA